MILAMAVVLVATSTVMMKSHSDSILLDQAETGIKVLEYNIEAQIDRVAAIHTGWGAVGRTYVNAGQRNSCIGINTLKLLAIQRPWSGDHNLRRQCSLFYNYT